MFFSSVFSQQLSDKQLLEIFSKDNVPRLDTVALPQGVNACYGPYSLLSHAVRFNAKKCFERLIEKGASVNQTCAGYIPPLMHAAKYGRVEFAKTLVAKGTKTEYLYDGPLAELKGKTPLKDAELRRQQEMVDYLKGLEKGAE